MRMPYRFTLAGLASCGLCALWIGVTPVAAQAPAARTADPAAKAAYKAPRTPDGQPDLQGFWTNQTYTPLQRPAAVTKEFYTLEEVIAAEKRSAQREAQASTPGTTGDVHYSGTEFGLDKSQGAFARNLRTSLIVDPPDGKLPPLSPEGERRAQAYAESRKNLGRFDQAQNNELDDRCISTPNAGPPMLPYAYNSNYQIVQAPGYVMILVEMMHHVRMIPLDNRPRPPQDVLNLTGVSRGRWEGDTLVVETTNLYPTTLFGGIDLDNSLDRPVPFRGVSDKVKVTEWFTRTGPDMIAYKFKVEDPTTWTKPWSAELPMKLTIGPLFEHACHEGNFGLHNTLAGARREEKQAVEEAAKKRN
jgi:hypothetical protein